MQAAVYHRYGPADVVHIDTIAMPTAGHGLVLVKVAASAVTTADWRIRASAFPGVTWLAGRLMFGLCGPRNPVLGTDFAGHVAAVGEGVTDLAVGDRVFGFAPRGAHAEYLAIDQDAAIARVPSGLSLQAAAAVPFGALAALVFLRDFGKVEPGQRVLINGASGGLGVFLVQIAKQRDAHVTGVASTGNLELVRSLGADRVIDYTQTDFAQADPAQEHAVYDLVVDTVGKTRYSQVRRVLAPKGVYLPLEFGLREVGQALVTAIAGGRRVKIGVSGDHRADLEAIADMLAAGMIRPVIDRTYPLAEIVAAHERAGSRHKRGSVVLAISDAVAASIDERDAA